MRSARTSATEPEEVPLCIRRRHDGRTFVGSGRFAVAAQPPKRIGSRGVERMVIVQV